MEKLLSEDSLGPLLALKEVVSQKVTKTGEDTVGLEFDSQLVSVLKPVRDLEIRIHQTHVPETQSFSGIPYGDFKKFFGSLMALNNAHLYLHMSPPATQILGLALSSLALRLSVPEFNRQMSIVSEISENRITELARLFVCDGSIPKLSPICQPIIQANGDELLIPKVFTFGSRLERNILKLLARHPLTTAEYQKFSSQKESIALMTLTPLLRNAGIIVKERASILDEGRRITDVDALAYDARDGCLLIIQHKWLIEPDGVNESKACDEEFRKGIEQAKKAEARLLNQGYARQLIPELPAVGYSFLGALVISRGLEPTGFLAETDIPVVTEELNLPPGVRQTVKRQCTVD
jgi:hypothetical protein